MRILTFIHSFAPGGVERVALRLVREWRAQGHDAPLFVGRAEGVMRTDVAAGLDYDLPAFSPVRVSRWETLWMILTLPRFIRDRRPDVLFCAGNTYAVVAAAMKLLLGPDCPPIVAKVSNDLDRADKTGLRRWSYLLWLKLKGRMLDHIVAMDEPMVDEIEQRLQVCRRNVTVIPDPALSIGMIERLRSPQIQARDDERRFVAVGRLVRQKNIGLLLRAFARAARRSDRLTLIGDGPERRRLEALARSLAIADQVTFAGYQSDPSGEMRSFDVLLLSSDYEGVPAVVLEALAANLAIVATDCSRSMSSLLEGGALGALIPVRDELAFVAAISAARPGSQDPQRSLAQCQRFTIEVGAARYAEVMSRVVAAYEPARTARDLRPPSSEDWFA